MGKLLKILGAIVGILVLLVVAAVIIVPMVVDPNDFKDEITAQVKKVTGRDLTIGGDLGLSVFPWLGLELNKLALSNAPGFGDQSFAAVSHAQVRAKLLPLLSKSLEVDTLKIDGLKLHLAKDKDGRTNWQDLAGPKAPVEAAPKEAAPKEESSAPAFAGLAIGGVELVDAEVVWEDQAAGQRYQIDGVDLRTGAITPGSPVDIALAFNVDSAEPMLKARVSLDSQLAIDDAMQQLVLSPLKLKISDLKTNAVNGEVQLVSQVNADLAAQRYGLNDLKVDLTVAGEGLPKDGVKARLVFSVLVDLMKETLSLRDLKVSSSELILTGAIQGEQILANPHFLGDLNVAEFSPRKLMQELGLAVPETADPETLERVALGVHLDSTQQRLAMENLVVSLDDTKLTGQVTLDPPAKPGIHFDLTVDAIDLDRYLPPPAEGESTAGKPGAKPTNSAEGSAQAPPVLLPVAMLRDLDIAGILRMGQVKVSNLTAKDLELKVKARDGRIDLNEAVKTFYEGVIEGSLGMDVTGAQPRLKLDQRIRDIQAGPLLMDLTGKDTLTGTGHVNATLNTSGLTQQELTQALGGKLDFRFTNGAVKGFNLAKILRDAKARFTGKTVIDSGEPQQTDFSELSGSATITKGVLVNKDLDAKSPFIRLEGEGEVDLAAQTLDYTATPIIVGTATGQGGKGLEELVGIPIPVKLTGPFAQPGYSIDWQKVLLTAQKTKLKEKTDKLQEKLEKKLDKQLDDTLKEAVPDSIKDSIKDKFKGFF